MASTTERGNAFRELVADLLRAAGFQADTEVRVRYKNADVRAMVRDDVSGTTRYAIEAKAFEGTLPLGECTAFVNDYQPLLRNGDIDQAWLISRGAISPSGRQAVEEADRGMKALTFHELQRRLLLLDSYLTSLVNEYDRQRIGEFYIRPEMPDGQDLESHVRSWLARDGGPPLFVLGPYGKGKSTFATHLASVLAREALGDPAARVPVLVRLGEIADEQPIDGLMGKVFASQHRVTNYHFDTFRALNRAGRFLIIYDGFDEMKHGLTLAKFNQVFSELMKLDEGEARILVLGRDTAFHDDAEFRSVIEGLQQTGGGRLIPAPGRRPYEHVYIRGFTPAEAKSYVQRYLPIRAQAEKTGHATDPAWVANRIEELISGRFDRLLERPVHAQMLCEIAVRADHLRPDMSVYELFDSFVHYLLNREVEKRGRDSDFSIDVRRRFNASLAWWLWDRGGASTTTLTDIPHSLCQDAVKDIRHSLSSDEMRRELIQGCLVEKGVNTIYFHRSLQEFLVADHFIHTDLLQRDSSVVNWFKALTSRITPEITEFVVAGAELDDMRRRRALDWIDAIGRARGENISLSGFNLFTQLAQSLHAEIQDVTDSPWFMWLAFFQRSGGRDFAFRGRNTFPVLADLLIAARDDTPTAQAAALHALARTLFHQIPGTAGVVATALAAMIPVRRLMEVVEEAADKKSERRIIQDTENYPLWVLLRSWKVDRDKEGVLNVTVDIHSIYRDSLASLPGRFEMDGGEDQQDTVTAPVQAIYQALAAQKPAVSEHEIDGIRRFFNDAVLRKNLLPIQIERRAVQQVSDPVVVTRPTRPTLRPSYRGS